MKTFFAITLTIITLFIQEPYPFKPSMMLLIEAFVIGIPSFMLTFEPNTKPIRGNFIPQVLKRSLPRALLMLINVLIILVLNSRGDTLSPDEYRTLCVLILTYTGFLNLATLCFPMTLIRGLTLAISFICITGAIIALPNLFSITSSSFTVLVTFFAIILASIIVIVLIKLNKKRIDKLRDKVISLLQKQ